MTLEEGGAVRADFVPKSDYVSPKVLVLENERLWPKVWQLACRLEELPQLGDYVTYEIVEQSILLVRVSESQVKAYYNVCQHRGRQLKEEGRGNTGESIFCRFHGWRYRLDGSVQRVNAREDWAGCDDFDDDALRLQEVRVDTWAGWVFINMDPDCEPLAQFLSPVPDILAPFLLEDLRFNWYKSLVFPCNWKTALDAFNEGYHTESTHPQMMKYGYQKFLTAAYGKHAMFYTGSEEASVEAKSTSTSTGTVAADVDARQFFLEYVEEMASTLKAMYTDNAVAAARRLVTELPANATPDDVGGAFMRFHREVIESKGARWPVNLTGEALVKAGIDWHIFPNNIVLPTVDGCLWYRARPNGNDPDTCIYDVWSLGRYKAGTEPKVEREFYPSLDLFKDNVPFLEQDFENLKMVQKGMHSRGFKGARTSPKQEVTVSNFHRALHGYIYGA